MTTIQPSPRITYTLLLIIILLSLPIKLAAARNMQWDIDIVPVLSRSVEYTLPPVGTLSSVAAYNMPMLVWLHTPALHLTHNPYLTILLTLLIFNVLSTLAVFGIGASMFNGRVGLIAAILFTFSEVGISSAYTAWAQLLLPGFYVMTFFFLWQWRKHEKGIYLALAGILATAAFMTHFSAILLYPAMLIFALVSRAKWQWKWLIGGVVACLLMLMPYLIFEAQHDFVDIRAFLKQDSRVAPDILAQLQYLKPESGRLPREQETATSAPDNVPSEQSSSTQQHSAIKPRWQRALEFVLSIPTQYLNGLQLAFVTNLRALPQVFRPVLFVPMLLFVLSSLWSVWQFVCEMSGKTPLSTSAAQWATCVTSRRQERGVGGEVIATLHGRILLLLLFVLTIISGLIVTRSIEQTTYFMGLLSLQTVIAAVAFHSDRLPRWGMILGIVLVVMYAGVSTADRIARLLQHDDTQYSPFNVSLYRHVAETVDYIAADWQGDDTLTISYDIMPEVRNLWWVAAWHSIDPSYRMGMNFDFLLSYEHGLNNTNADPIGYIAEADYFVVYEPGLLRFNLDDYTIAQFGTIYVLKPKQN
jgi:4-amino-4-deoxy-L-arabinose transferase-like glycosyltransferase